jgi:uracil-DNA glycosylase
LSISPVSADREAIPAPITDQLALAAPSWRPILLQGLEAIAQAAPEYLSVLAKDDYLPNGGRLFAAFTPPIEAVEYVLIGEGPYPRPESATGVCFMDGAVHSLWSEKGFSKPVNRATSLRNFMKMLLVADGLLKPGQTSGEEVARVAATVRENAAEYTQTLEELQDNLTAHGFLLLNASLVFRPHVPPLKDAKAWQPFLQTVLDALVQHSDRNRKSPPTLVLWGKIAGLLSELPANTRFPKAISEHPYNLTFINSATMQALFGPMHLLRKRGNGTRKGNT